MPNSPPSPRSRARRCSAGCPRSTLIRPASIPPLPTFTHTPPPPRPVPHAGQAANPCNQPCAAFLQEGRVFAEPTSPYSGNQKGCVESLVKFVKGAFFQARRFRHRADLLAQLADWLHYTNEERPCDATGVPPAVRLRAGAPHPRPPRVGGAGLGLALSRVGGRAAPGRRLGLYS